MNPCWIAQHLGSLVCRRYDAVMDHCICQSGFSVATHILPRTEKDSEETFSAIFGLCLRHLFASSACASAISLSLCCRVNPPLTLSSTTRVACKYPIAPHVPSKSKKIRCMEKPKYILVELKFGFVILAELFVRNEQPRDYLGLMALLSVVCVCVVCKAYLAQF
eukprot:TRINITY_DN8316_c0_g1_i2.p1 TRINITY_DN8316_c0_g1~~TRINITY_DN8316_c0_g1_i2.p1  ORF type:complete len:164 (-),score=7.25 TRINITY_DN8316_c0_g1_i2:98-589(-)